MDLCTSCKRLNISLASFISHPGTDDNPRLKDPIYELGRLNEFRKKYKTCPFCRLVFAAFQSGPIKRVAELTDLSKIAVFATWINALGSSKAERLKSASLAILVWAESPQIPSGSYKIVLRAVSKMLPDQPHFGHISPTKCSLLDFDQIKHWLRHCQTRHSSCSDMTKPSRPTRHFFVIDVHFKRIVEAPEQCRYLALSYVWGSARQYKLSEDNQEMFRRKDSLKSKYLTTTIRDSIELTDKLGERYLWVDALCIVQDSNAIRQQTLQDMDRIYADSLLTIVAGTCSSANDVLPGVTQERVWTQWYQKVSASLTLSAHFDYKDFLDYAIYSERAWTFQEYQLANRLLVFASNGQVYFSCRETVHSEEVVPSTAFDADAAMLQGAELIKLRHDPNMLWSTYRRSVEIYTARKMTNPNDVIDAFSGIMRTLCNARCVEGLLVPVFDIALLWQPRERLRRRGGFSSWSWAGWIGQVHWFDDRFLENFEQQGRPQTETIKLWVEAHSWIVWYSSSGTNCQSRAFRMDGPPRLSGSQAHNSGKLLEKHFPGQHIKSLPTPSLLPDRLENLENYRHQIRYLQFWTLSVHFNIELDALAVIHHSSLEPENTGNGLRRFHLIDQYRRECGWVLLNEDWIEKTTSKEDKLQEFILISETGGSEQISDLREEELGQCWNEYNAMMIVWEHGIAERVGLGRVMKHSLVDSTGLNLEWKEILLG